MTRPANILALAALGTLAVNPAYLFDVGCQLSFLAIVALAWLVPPACEALRLGARAARDRLLGPPSPLDELERKLEPRWRTRLRTSAGRVIFGVVTSTVVWLSALPLVALTFHVVAPIGILLNIPLIPITSTALLLGGLGLGLSAVWGPLGVPASRAAGVLLDVTQRVVLWGVARPWGYRFVAGPGWAWVLVFYGLAHPGRRRGDRPRRRRREPGVSGVMVRGGCWPPGRWAAGSPPASRPRPGRPRPMSWPSATGWRSSSRRPAAARCSTTAAGWAIRPSGGGSSRRPSGRAGSRGSTRSASATPTRTTTMDCPTCSTGSPSAWCASRRGSAARPIPTSTACSPRSVRAASRSGRPPRPSRGSRAASGSWSGTRPSAGISRPPTTRAASCSTSTTPAATCS